MEGKGLESQQPLQGYPSYRPSSCLVHPFLVPQPDTQAFHVCASQGQPRPNYSEPQRLTVVPAKQAVLAEPPRAGTEGAFPCLTPL